MAVRWTSRFSFDLLAKIVGITSVLLSERAVVLDDVLLKRWQFYLLDLSGMQVTSFGFASSGRGVLSCEMAKRTRDAQ